MFKSILTFRKKSTNKKIQMFWCMQIFIGVINSPITFFVISSICTIPRLFWLSWVSSRSWWLIFWYFRIRIVFKQKLEGKAWLLVPGCQGASWGQPCLLLPVTRPGGKSESHRHFHSQFESPFIQIKYLSCSLNSVWCRFHKSPLPQSWPCSMFTGISEPPDVRALFPLGTPSCPRRVQA